MQSTYSLRRVEGAPTRRLIRALLCAVTIAGSACSSSTTVATAPTRLAEVFVAKRTIPRGATAADVLNASDIDQTPWPVELKPDQEIRVPDELRGKVALFNIPAGTVITQGMFIDPPLYPPTNGPVPTRPTGAPPIVPRPVTTASDGRVTVFVVKTKVNSRLPAEKALTAKAIEVRMTDAQYRPETAVTSLDDLGGTFAQFDLEPGSLLVTGMFA